MARKEIQPAAHTEKQPRPEDHIDKKRRFDDLRETGPPRWQTSLCRWAGWLALVVPIAFLFGFTILLILGKAVPSQAWTAVPATGVVFGGISRLMKP